MLHFALVIPSLFLRNALSLPCESWEYSIGGECCPKCDPGLRVLTHCTSATGTVCVSCNLGWYMDHPNGLTMCLKCRQCSPGNHMQIKERCHYSMNTKCTCQPGFYCFHQLEADSCDVCARHTTAPAGSRVTQAGTENYDVKFEPCPPGTFSSKEMSFFCLKWTNCSEKGMVKTREGNATSDVVCEPPPSNHLGVTLPIAFVSSFILLALLAVLLFFVFRKNKKRRPKAIGKKKTEEPYGMGPEKEYMVTPIQETAPNLGEPSYAKC